MSRSIDEAPDQVTFALEVRLRAALTPIEEAIVTMAQYYLAQPSGDNKVHEGLRLLRKVDDISDEQLIRIIKRLGRRDWLRAWYPQEIANYELLAENGLAIKRAKHSQQAMVEFLIYQGEGLKGEKERDTYWRAVVFLLYRKSLAAMEARFLLVRAGFQIEADLYAPIVREVIVTGEANSAIDDWWRM